MLLISLIVAVDVISFVVVVVVVVVAEIISVEMNCARVSPFSILISYTKSRILLTQIKTNAIYIFIKSITNKPIDIHA